MDYSGIDYSGIDYSGIDYSGIDYSGIGYYGTVYHLVDERGTWVSKTESYCLSRRSVLQ
jgi:hypothetical protein